MHSILSASTLDGINSTGFVQTTGTQTIFGFKTFQNVLTLNSSLKENVYAISGTTPDLDPGNGTIQTWTLTGNSSPTESFSSGESITLMINDGSDYTITWPTITWINNGGLAPDLLTTGYTVIILWKVGSVLYGSLASQSA